MSLDWLESTLRLCYWGTFYRSSSPVIVAIILISDILFERSLGLVLRGTWCMSRSSRDCMVSSGKDRLLETGLPEDHGKGLPRTEAQSLEGGLLLARELSILENSSPSLRTGFFWMLLLCNHLSLRIRPFSEIVGLACLFSLGCMGKCTSSAPSWFATWPL